MKHKEIVTEQKNLGRWDNNTQGGTLEWILEQKEDINGKTGERQIVLSQVKSQVPM